MNIRGMRIHPLIVGSLEIKSPMSTRIWKIHTKEAHMPKHLNFIVLVCHEIFALIISMIRYPQITLNINFKIFWEILVNLQYYILHSNICTYISSNLRRSDVLQHPKFNNSKSSPKINCKFCTMILNIKQHRCICGADMNGDPCLHDHVLPSFKLRLLPSLQMVGIPPRVFHVGLFVVHLFLV